MGSRHDVYTYEHAEAASVAVEEEARVYNFCARLRTSEMRPGIASHAVEGGRYLLCMEATSNLKTSTRRWNPLAGSKNLSNAG